MRLYPWLKRARSNLKKLSTKDLSATNDRRRRTHTKADIALSVSCILGVAGVELSQDHALATAEVLNKMHPQQIGVLTLMLLDETPLARSYQKGEFQLPDKEGLLLELRTLVQHLDLPRCQFHVNHPSNYLALSGRLPQRPGKDG